jgi:hypothetical protein
MSKSRPAKPRPKKPAAATRSKPAAVAKRPHVVAADEAQNETEDAAHGPMCRSCGKRPGRPTAILGQMTQAELCPQCTALRKERIRINRAAARGLRSSRLF